MLERLRSTNAVLTTLAIALFAAFVASATVPAKANVYLAAPQRGKIKHIVVIVQENRSFNNLFQGYPGAYTTPTGINSKGQVITLTPWSLKNQYIIDHSFNAFQAAYDNGKMDGFDLEEEYGGPTNPEYVYVPHNESKPYFDIAHEFVVGDRMFASHLDESFISHQYIIAGTASRAVNLPYGLWGCDGGPSDVVRTLNNNRTYGGSEQACFDNETIGDEADKAKLSWRFYAAKVFGDGNEWSAYDAIRHIRYGPDWTKNVITPNTQILTDIQNGFLANISWVTPTCETSDHVNCGGGLGPPYVASIVNAIGTSKFWNDTAIFVMWDEWGGLYDPVPPPYKDFDGNGMRVPLLVVSPFAKKDYVTHVQYEHGSILKFIEDTFGFHRLAAADTRANSPAIDCFNWNLPPRKFVKIPSQYDANFFIHRPIDRRLPDED